MENWQTNLIKESTNLINGRLLFRFQQISESVLTEGIESGDFSDFTEEDYYFLMRVCLLIAVERTSLDPSVSATTDSWINEEGVKLYKKVKKMMGYKNKSVL